MKMKISILNTFLPGPSVMISWVMDAPLTSLFAIHSKLKWSPRTFIKQDDGIVMPKQGALRKFLVVNLVKKKDVRNMLMHMVLRTQ